LLKLGVEICSYNNHRSAPFFRALLVGISNHQLYSGVGADVVMESITLTDFEIIGVRPEYGFTGRSGGGACAASNGDRSENADYQYGKRRLRQIDGRIRARTACQRFCPLPEPGSGANLLAPNLNAAGTVTTR
jgi:hypothetical protein